MSASATAMLLSIQYSAEAATTAAVGGGTITYDGGTPTDTTGTGGGFELDDASGTITVSGVTIEKTASGSGQRGGLEIVTGSRESSNDNPANDSVAVIFTGAGSHLTNSYNLDGLFLDGSAPTLSLDTSGTSSGNVFSGGTNGIYAEVFGNTTVATLTIKTGAADTISATANTSAPGGANGGKGIYAAARQVIVVNNATILYGANYFQTGIGVYHRENSSITNNGSVTAGAIGIDDGNSGSDYTTVVNTGSVSAATGIYASLGQSNISNGTSAGPNTAMIAGSVYGVRTAIGYNHILTNYAGATISGTTDSLLMNGRTDTAINYGTLTGDVSLAANTGTLNNYGILNGGITAADSGSAAIVNLYAGSNTSGTVDISASTQANSVTVYTGSSSAAAAIFHALTAGSGAQLYLAGSGDGTVGNGAAGTLDPNAVTGFGGVTQLGTGLWRITASDAGFATPIAVNAGTLQVSGSIPNAAIAVNIGGTLAGTGTVGITTVTSGTLAPGAGGIGTLTVTGNLSLDGGSTYAVDVASGSADETIVTGTAAIAGTVQATYAAGSYSAGQYTLISAAGGLSGTFTGLVGVNALPSGYAANLSYDANDVYLNLVGNAGFVWSATPVSSDFNTGVNWQGGTVPGPADTAEFSTSTNTAVAIGQATPVKNIQLDSGAPAYTFAVTGSNAGAASLTLATGITDLSGNAPAFTVSGISGNTGTLAFTGTGNAADANLTAGNFGIISFTGLADAGAAATLVAQNGGTIDFSGTTGTANNNQVAAGSVAGAGNFNLGANTLTAGALDTSTTVDGVISGTGGVVKTGSGTLTLSGVNTYTGGTSIADGTLLVTGSIARSAVSAANGGTLGGTGTVGGVALADGATLAPGVAGIGTLAVDGSLSLAAGGTYAVDIGPTAADEVTVAGNASVAGNVSATYSGGTYAAGQYTLISATGGVSGTFSSFTATNAIPTGYAASLSYDANDVYLNLIGNAGFVWSATPVSSDFNTGANWQGGVVPGAADTAEFSTTTNPAVTVAQAAAVKNIQLDSGAPAYDFAITGSVASAASLTLTNGIVDLSANAPSLTASGTAEHTGTLAFTGTGTVADAHLTAGANGIVSFGGTSDAGAAAVLTALSGGTIDFSGTTGAANNDQVAAGSIAGAGNFNLGANMLTEGALNTSTAVDGVISGTGGVVKTGSGTLTLSGVNTYSGGTDIATGTLALSGTGSIASSSGVSDSGTFDISGAASGVAIASLSGTGNIILGGNNLTLANAAGTFSGTISGTGGVALAAGSETLSATSNYTGATTINAGAILFLAGAGSIATSSGVVDNGTLDTSGVANVTIAALTGTGGVTLRANALNISNAAGTFSGTISGTGGDLTIAAGNQTFTGTNTYTGTTTIASGTVQIGDGGMTGTLGTGAVVDNGALIFDRSDTLTETAPLTGTGSVTQAGAGTLILTSINNTYSGGTDIAAGTLQIGNGGTSGQLGTGAIVDNATLAVDRSDTVTLSGISGSGGLNQIGAGTTILLGGNTYSGTTTIGAGSLYIGYQDTNGSVGTGPIVDNANLTFDQTGSTTVANAISGSGTLYISRGLTNLTAANTYTGVTVSGGTLVLSGAGSIAESSSVSSEYRLDISGTTAGATFVRFLSGANSFVFLGDQTLTVGSGEIDGAITNGTIAGGGGSGGGITVNGGALELTGSNNYQTTTINGGLLVAGNGGLGGNLGSRSFAQNGAETDGGIIIDDGTLAFNRSQDFTLEEVISGAGDIVKSGSDTILFASADSHTGTTTIVSGALIFYGGDQTTLGSGAIIDNAKFEFEHVSTTVGNVISGTGEVDQILPDTIITLTANNSYAGATNINYGTLALAGSGSIASSSVVNDRGTFDISATDNGATINTLADGPQINAANTLGTIVLGSKTLTIAHGSTGFSGAIGGTGSVVIAGGTQTLTGNNTYSGGTTVDASSTLVISSPASLGTGTISFQAGSTIKFAGGGTYSQGAVFAAHAPIYDTDGNAVTWAGQMSGPGDLAVTGGGTLILTNTANSYGGGTEVYGGTVLQVDADSELGAPAPLELGDATTSGTLQLAGALNLDPARAIILNAGGGIIDTQGFGSSVIQAITGAGGLTKVGSGILTLAGNNTYSGATAVKGGTLLITGSIASSAVGVAAGGTLAGTGTVGTTTVAGGGTLSPGNGGIGTLHIAGGLTLASGATTAIDIAPATGDEVIVTGAASLGGTLALAPAAGAYVPGTDYKLISAASLTGTFSNVTGSFAGYTSNLVYSATGVDLVLNYPFTSYATTPNQTAVATVLNVSPAGSEPANALGQVVGPNPGAVPGALAQLAGEIHAGIRSAAIEGDRLIHDIVLSHLRVAADGLTVWGSGFGGYGSIRGDGNAGGLHHDTAGFIAGIDVPLGDGLRAGAAGAYMAQNVNIAERASRASGNSGHLIGYADWSDGPYDVRLGGDYGWGTDHITRQITALSETNDDDQNEQVWQIYGDAGYRIAVDPAIIEPYIDIAHISATSGRFRETGSDSALSGDAESDGETYSTIGMRAALNGVSLADVTVTPKIDLGWQHAFDTILPSQRLAFVTTGQGFSVLDAPLANDAAALQVGFDATLAPDAILFLGYDGTFSSRVQNNAIRGTLSWKF